MRRFVRSRCAGARTLFSNDPCTKALGTTCLVQVICARWPDAQCEKTAARDVVAVRPRNLRRSVSVSQIERSAHFDGRVAALVQAPHRPRACALLQRDVVYDGDHRSAAKKL